jgi:hypothetical protein
MWGGNTPFFNDYMKLLIAIPTHTGQVFSDCMQSVVNNIRVLESCNIRTTLHIEPGEAYVPRARNKCIHRLMSNDYDAIVFVDYDLAFRQDAIADLVLSDKDIAGCTYPKKCEKTDYPVQVYNPEEKEGDLQRVSMLPSGLIMIKRYVFAQIDKSIRIKTDSDLKIKWYYDTGFLFNDNRWYGEDVTFCKRCSLSGIKMWLYPDVKFVHIGVGRKIGSYKEDNYVC